MLFRDIYSQMTKFAGQHKDRLVERMIFIHKSTNARFGHKLFEDAASMF